MTTEGETQRVLNIIDIPDDWSNAFDAGHIFMAPADFRRGVIRMDDIKVLVAGIHEAGQFRGHVFDDLSNLHSALGQAGYTIREFPIGSVEIAPERVAQDAATAFESYHDRLADLRAAAVEEGIEWSEDSEQDFRTFVTSNPGWRRGDVVLMNNGNLRAIWDDDNDDDRHVALQFLGGGHVQYVIFKRRPGAIKVSRVAGTDTFDGIKRQVEAFALNQLVYA